MTTTLYTLATFIAITAFLWIRCALIQQAKWTRCKQLIEQYKDSYEPSDWDDWMVE